MEDIVAVAVHLDSGKIRYFLTWGRIQAAVDPAPLERMILEQSNHFHLGGKAVTAHLCSSLQEASGEFAFYECFFDMCQQKIPYGETTYPKWREEMDKKMKNGKEIWFLGIK